MPPKKKKAPKKGNNEDLDGMQIVLPEDRIKYLESQTQALEMQLVYRSEATANAVAKCETIGEELADATQKYEGEKKISLDVTRSMTRQYKGMQESLLNKITEREGIIEILKDEIETLKTVHEEQIAQKEIIIRAKDADAEGFQVETQTMFRHFANMLVDARLSLAANTKCAI